KAADALRLTAPDLMGFGVIDEIVTEPLGGAHRSIPDAVRSVRDAILANLARVEATPIDRLLEERYQKVRKIGVLLEKTDAPEVEVEVEAPPEEHDLDLGRVGLLE